MIVKLSADANTHAEIKWLVDIFWARIVDISENLVTVEAILASAFAKNDFERATSTASRVLQLGFVLGLVLCFMLGFGLKFAARLFTKDVNVLNLITIGIPAGDVGTQYRSGIYYYNETQARLA